MFKLTRKYALLTRFNPKEKYLRFLDNYLTKEQIEFLQHNWYSLGAVGLIVSKGEKEMNIYEIKTQNYMPNRPYHWRPKITKSQLEIYEKARSISLTVKTAMVVLHEDWEYDVQISPFSIA